MIRVEDFVECSALVKAYELQPGKHYLVFVDAKGFRQDTLQALLGGIRGDHPELSVHVVATPGVAKIKVMEEKDGSVPVDLPDAGNDS